MRVGVGGVAGLSRAAVEKVAARYDVVYGGVSRASAAISGARAIVCDIYVSQRLTVIRPDVSRLAVAYVRDGVVGPPLPILACSCYIAHADLSRCVIHRPPRGSCSPAGIGASI